MPSTKRSATKTAARHKIPAALVRNDERLVAAKLARLKQQALDDVDLVVVKQVQIADTFFEIGQALLRLNRPGTIDVLGHKSFEELCTTRLKLAITSARELMLIATRVRRADARLWLRDKSEAIVEVAHAIDPLDEAVIDSKQLQAAVHGDIDLANADAASLHRYARQVRHAHQSGHGPTRGRTTTPEERGLAERIEKALHAAGLPQVRVLARATAPRKPSNLTIQGLPIDRLEVFDRALQTELRRSKRHRAS